MAARDVCGGRRQRRGHETPPTTTTTASERNATIMIEKEINSSLAQRKTVTVRLVKNAQLKQEVPFNRISVEGRLLLRSIRSDRQSPLFTPYLFRAKNYYGTLPVSDFEKQHDTHGAPARFATLDLGGRPFARTEAFIHATVVDVHDGFEVELVGKKDPV